MESPATGGVNLDKQPRELDPTAHVMDTHGLTFQSAGTNDLSVYVYRRSDGNLAFADANNAETTLGALVAAAGGGITALSGDVSSTGSSGTANVTVNKVGGALANAIASAANLVAASQTQNYVWAAPASGNGAALFRALVAADIPTLPTSQLSPSGANAGDVLTLVSGAWTHQALAALTGLTGDVSIPASYGSVAVTINKVGGATSAAIANAAALTTATQSANVFYGGPASGAAAIPSWRALVAADIPTIPYTQVSGLAASAYTDTTNASNIGTGSLALNRLAQTGASPGDTITWNGSQFSVSTPTHGTVTSVGLTAPSIFTGSIPAVTTSGNLALALATQTANLVWAGPTTGAAAVPSFRSLVSADLPTIPLSLLSTSGASANYVIGYNGSTTAWVAAATGTVTSVGLTAPSIFTGSITPVTTSGALALTLATQSPNFVWAGPASGSTAAAPSFRALVAADIPVLPLTNLSTTGASTNYVPTYNGTTIVWAAQQGSGSSSYPLLAPSGSAAAPSYSFSSATGAGMYADGNNNLAFASGGSEVLYFNGNFALFQGRVGLNGGTVSAPGYSFLNNGNSGVYSTGTGNISLSAGSTQVFSATGTTVTLPKGLYNLALNGSTSGATTLAAAATTTAYTLTLPSAVAGAASVFASDTGGNVSYLPYTAAGSSVGGSALLQRDGSGYAQALGFGLNGSSTGILTLLAAASTTSYTLKFPATQGAANTTFSNDGNGVLSWVALSGASTINSAANNTSYPLLVKTGTTTYGSLDNTSQTANFTGYGITLVDKPVTNTRNPTFFQAQWYNNQASSEGGSIQTTAYAAGGTGGQANENIDLYFYRQETATGGSSSVSGALIFPGSLSSIYGNVGQSVYLKSGTPYTAGTGGVFVKGNSTVVLGSNALTAATSVALNSAALSIYGSIAAKGTLYLNGSTSGYVGLMSPAAPTSWSMTLPTSPGTAGYFLTTDGTGVTSWAAASGSASGTTNNVVATVPQRDSTGAIFRSQSIVPVASASTQSPAFTSSDNEYQFTAASGTMTVNMYTPATNNTFPIIRASSIGNAAASIVTIAPQNNGYFSYPAGSGMSGYSANNLVSKSVNAAIKLTATPQNGSSVANWTVESMLGVFYDASNQNYFTSAFATTDAFYGQATSQQTNSTLMMRDTTASTSANNLTLGGYASLSKPLRIFNQSATPATVSGYSQIYTRSSDLQPMLVDSSGTLSQFLTTNGLATHVAPVGTVSAPGVTFLGALNCGLYLNASGFPALVTLGVERLTVNNQGVVATGTLNSTGSITAATAVSANTYVYAGTVVQISGSGAANNCAVQLAGVGTMGLYSPGTGQLAVTVSAVQAMLATSTAVTFPNATTMTFGASACVVTVPGSMQLPVGNNTITCTTDTGQGLGFATNFLRLYGPGSATWLFLGNNSSFYGAGIGVNPMTTANNALAIGGALAVQENTQPATATGYTHFFGNATDHHIYSSNATWGQVAVSNGGTPVSKSTTAASTTVATTDNGRLWTIDGSYAGTSTLTLPATSTTADQTFRITQTQTTYGFTVTAPASSYIQMGNITSSAAGSVSANQLGCGFTLVLPKGKSTWVAVSHECSGTGVFTLS